MTTKTTFWPEYLKRVKPAKLDTPDHYLKALHHAKDHLIQAIETFQQDLAKTPIGAGIEGWLQSLDLPQNQIAEYETDLLRLIDLRLLRLVNASQNLRMLIELTPTQHQALFEEIRCSTKLTTAEKEKTINTYILFSQYLSKTTLGLITQGEDPDCQHTTKKAVPYKEFTQFIQHLQARDALIAKLLYFGAPTMDEVLNLRVHQVNLKKEVINFHKAPVQYPKHVMLELKEYLNQHDKNALLFVNLRGDMVERTHLNNCFNRASRKISSTKRITPKMLLESGFAHSVATSAPSTSLSPQ